MKYYAEYETDKYIRETFFSDYSYVGSMVEVGAGPPEFYSMSKHFRDNGWRCICVEPNPKFVKQHKLIGNEIYQYACADFIGKSNFTVVNIGWPDDIDGISNSALSLRYINPIDTHHPMYTIDEVSVITLDKLLQELSISNIDLLAVDTEGWELDVMRGIDTTIYNPKVIMLENISRGTEYTEYMNGIGYKLDHVLVHNYIYVKN